MASLGKWSEKCCKSFHPTWDLGRPWGACTLGVDPLAYGHRSAACSKSGWWPSNEVENMGKIWGNMINILEFLREIYDNRLENMGKTLIWGNTWINGGYGWKIWGKYKLCYSGSIKVAQHICYMSNTSLNVIELPRLWMHVSPASVVKFVGVVFPVTSCAK